MTHRKVGDVMTAEVVTVPEDVPFKELAGIMIERGVSALPVLDHQGRVTGAVSETDLLRKEEYQEDPEAKRPPRWRHHDAKVRAAGVTAGDVMTSPPVTITPDASIVAAARALDRHHVRRLVVTSADGWLAGIVTLSDLLRIYLRSGEEIRTEILQQVIAGDLGTNPDLVKVAARDGVATLAGRVGAKNMIAQAVRLSRAVDGVVDVVEQIDYAHDDVHVPPRGVSGAESPGRRAAGGNRRMRRDVTPWNRPS
jgi:CBS domain-containing protein